MFPYNVLAQLLPSPGDLNTHYLTLPLLSHDYCIIFCCATMFCFLYNTSLGENIKVIYFLLVYCLPHLDVNPIRLVIWVLCITCPCVSLGPSSSRPVMGIEWLIGWKPVLSYSIYLTQLMGNSEKHMQHLLICKELSRYKFCYWAQVKN